MYGAKRLKIEKSGMIVIVGNRTYNPIGKFFNINGCIVGKLRKVENPFETSLDVTNSIDFKLDNITELRKYVKQVYQNEFA